MTQWQASVERFCYQYLQLEANPTLPPREHLKIADAQEAIYESVFADGARHEPPARYKLRVLKALVAAIESSIDDWEEYALSDNLMSAMSVLLAEPLPSEVDSAQQKCYVTYVQSLLPAAVPDKDGKTPSSESWSPPALASHPSITLLENRSLISASGTTGLRTWEAALHLGQYLCLHPSLVRGKRVLELGAGTGYLSVLCAAHLGASHVIASDGSDDVVNNLPENFFLNGLQTAAGTSSDRIAPMDMKWGHALVGTEEASWNGGRDLDVVLGADITYDASVIPLLVGTLGELFGLYPRVEVYISATQRNEATFAVFLDVCAKTGLAVDDLGYAVPARERQTGPFYSDAVDIRACRIRRGS